MASLAAQPEWRRHGKHTVQATSNKAVRVHASPVSKWNMAWEPSRLATDRRCRCEWWPCFPDAPSLGKEMPSTEMKEACRGCQPVRRRSGQQGKHRTRVRCGLEGCTWEAVPQLWTSAGHNIPHGPAPCLVQPGPPHPEGRGRAAARCYATQHRQSRGRSCAAGAWGPRPAVPAIRH